MQFCSSEKKFFWWETKNDKNIRFWKFQNPQNMYYLGETALWPYTYVDSVVVWFVIFIFLRPQNIF